MLPLKLPVRNRKNRKMERRPINHDLHTKTFKLYMYIAVIICNFTMLYSFILHTVTLSKIKINICTL